MGACAITERREAQVGARLRAVMAALNLTTNKDLGELCEATDGAVNNWRCGYNLPRVPEMIRLCERTGITLDWLHRGYVGSMDLSFALKLARLMARPAD
jgi:transcriptional regulator with XRE-family HTH domain